MALQQMIDKKNTFLFIWWILASFLPRTNLKIVSSGTNFVKSRQTILICLALVMTESLSKYTAFSLARIRRLLKSFRLISGPTVPLALRAPEKNFEP